MAVLARFLAPRAYLGRLDATCLGLATLSGPLREAGKDGQGAAPACHVITPGWQTPQIQPPPRRCHQLQVRQRAQEPTGRSGPPG